MSDKRFDGLTAVMSGGSRGIGLAIATELARGGANLVLLAKTDNPDPRLPGTIHTAVDEIEQAGGRAVGVVGDVRNDDDVQRAARTAAEEFGGIDICINNASVLNLAGTEDLPLKRFDLIQQVNVRGTFALTQACLPYLKKSSSAHILTLSPPLNMSEEWLGKHPGYMLGKYGMTLLTLSFAAEFRESDIAANCLWPETTIATAAVKNLLGGEEGTAHARSPQIMADAAAAILSHTPGRRTGQTMIDVDVLNEAGVTDLSSYGGTDPLDYDIFVDPR
ncbi:SDR family oxidoreductase [Rhodococcoides kyotonense]|uniref:NAD(P)-dependent dehydrogenase, short-chain alcohol dehydrogenase family n=1 Tax=Rhodococcoides kyotonense TaxID=398843 RepID=A0A239IVJ9_9NOCA|nr:NAD(P)-dependent oxidoreductase [Rhodococcus kyotonensis]SNS97228.1 NAD(P)-dependent dehydrogenase, short-chain alcohol dehydrogenase family [Rhodococcus kyotonensis]